ncbi:MAG TPA: hypothetical protein VM120_25210 [Bryobacteraceae bacterium]|nr:hypothetical protein [Bryobacteraceae bacterium]
MRIKLTAEFESIEDLHQFMAGDTSRPKLEARLTTLEGDFRTMATDNKAAYAALVSGMNEATNGLAKRIEALEAAKAAGGMSAADETATLAELSAIKDTLLKLGANPADPIPGTELPPVV